MKSVFLPVGPTLGEIVFFIQMSSLGVESGLDVTFKVIDHVGVDGILFKVVEV
jgi:hypothetical protein